jgi:3-phosphoshikimate 1-carboxyvinyltransferase
VHTLRVPGDKSISHRVLILAALARGESRLRGVSTARDPASTASVLRALGANVPAPGAAEMRVTGVGLRGLRPAPAPLDCGNSGTTARLMLGVLAAQPSTAELTGDASLCSRPMRRVTSPLSCMGARFEELGQPDHLPIRVHGGPLQALEYSSPRASAQVKSALLLAGLCGGVAVQVSEPVLSRDHTERLLAGLGVPLSLGRDEVGTRVALTPVDEIPALDVDVPGDVSAAAFFLALALLSTRGALRIADVGVNPTRTGLLEVLRRMGARVQLDAQRDAAGEPVADLVCSAGGLRSTAVTPEEVPSLVDEVPVLAVLAARAEGETRITGAAELRVKESDRLAALAANLRALGVAVDELADGLAITGTDAPLSGRVRGFGDHRIAMAFAVLAAQPGNDIRLDDADIAAVSFPGFQQQLDAAAAALVLDEP